MPSIKKYSYEVLLFVDVAVVAILSDIDSWKSTQFPSLDCRYCSNYDAHHITQVVKFFSERRMENKNKRKGLLCFCYCVIIEEKQIQT